MLQQLQKQGERRELVRQWVGAAGLAVAVAIAYFLATRLSFFLRTKPDDVAWFWPAAGVAAGVLIALGPGARLPVAVGTIVASIPGNLLAHWSLWTCIVFALCNAGQVLFMAGLIERYFGSAFSLDSLRQVLGLVAAAIAATAIAAIGGTLAIVLVEGSPAPPLTIWYHWLTSNVPAIVAVAPLLIGLASAVRDPPPRGEIIESGAALVALTALSGLFVFLPREPWVIVALVALLFPLLLWLAARCRPVFAAAGVFIVAFAIVWTTTFSIGIFNEENFPIAERTLAAQAAILAVSLCAIVLASLFSERRESEARLARSKGMLERERDNKLLNAQAITAAIAHEIRQPLAGVAINADTALRCLAQTPLDRDRLQKALNLIKRDAHRTSEAFDGIRALFGKRGQERKPIEINRIVLDVIESLQADLNGHGVVTRSELATELPVIDGHPTQLQEVIFNLINNAIEAMSPTTNGSRVLRVRTEIHGGDEIAVSVQDSGPGIDPQQLDNVFNAFVSTKTSGTGLGLAICRMIVEGHGGRLVGSSDGKNGALFQFTLPIRSAANGTIE